MTDPNVEDDPVFYDHQQLVERGLSDGEAWDLIRLRETRAEHDAEAREWSFDMVAAAKHRLLDEETGHPLFRLPDDDII